MATPNVFSNVRLLRKAQGHQSRYCESKPLPATVHAHAGKTTHLDTLFNPSIQKKHGGVCSNKTVLYPLAARSAKCVLARKGTHTIPPAKKLLQGHGKTSRLCKAGPATVPPFGTFAAGNLIRCPIGKALRTHGAKLAGTRLPGRTSRDLSGFYGYQ